MEKIPTAEKIFLKCAGLTTKDSKSIYTKDATKAMIEFAKLHVKAALKTISTRPLIKKTTLVGEDEIVDHMRIHGASIYKNDGTNDRIEYTIDKESILSAYPETLIV